MNDRPNTAKLASQRMRWLAGILLAAALFAMWVTQLTGNTVDDDAAQSVRMGYNLLHHGVISMDRTPPLYPTNYREPIPILVNALSMALIEGTTGPVAPEAYDAGNQLRLLKLQNIFWLALLSLGTFLVVKTQTSSFWAALLAVAAINVPLRPQPHSVVDDLMTELAATALLIAASYALSQTFISRRWSLAAICGVLFGMLALTKAIVFYVFPPTALLLYLWAVATADAPRLARLELLRRLGIMLASYLVVLSPWVYRNHVVLGTEGISQRGGMNLYQRALEDRLSPVEYAGAIYYWAPTAIRNWLGRRLGFSMSDLEQGGRLQRLNEEYPSALSQYDEIWERERKPENAVTFYGKSRASRTLLEFELSAAGQSPELAQLHADDILMKRGVSMILEEPWAHVKLMVLLLWRSAFRALALLAVVLAVAVAQRRYQLIAFVLPTLLTILAYSAASTFFVRFGFPSYELALVAFVIALCHLYQRLRMPAHHP